jgi:hypothetical protein
MTVNDLHKSLTAGADAIDAATVNRNGHDEIRGVFGQREKFRRGLDVALLPKFEQISDQKSKNMHVTGKVDPHLNAARVTGKQEVK